MKRFLVLFSLLGTAGVLGAQSISTGSSSVANQGHGTAVSSPFQNKQKAYLNSQAQFAAHNYAAAEALLQAANVAAAGSPQWHLESGFDLMRMAFNFKSNGDAPTAQAIARLALAHLKSADRSYNAATNAGELANVKELTGYIYQNLLGDQATAKTCYRDAVALSPTTGNAATLLAAINASEAALARKLAATQSN